MQKLGAVPVLARTLAGLFGAFLFGATTHAAAPYAWVQLGDGGRAELRAISPGKSCPRAEIDGRAEPMRLRAGPDPAFPVTVCQASLPPHARSAAVDGIALKLPVAEPRRIVVIGDTGCRVEGLKTQACNDPRAWPFAELARRAAAERPDLIIHVGDYYYRETACPALAHSRCAGTPHGDAWPAWDADFFEPAQPLLEAAPWVFVRGNHESCSRGGAGWFRLLDAAPRPLACPASSAPFTVSIGSLRLFILDSADAEDRSAPPAQVAAISRQLDALGPELAAGDGWIITHRPVWGLVPVVRLGPLGPLDLPINATLQAGLRGHDLNGVQMVLSGHIHHFAAFDFHGRRPAQLIVGTGGDIGLPADSPKLTRDTVMIAGLSAAHLTFDRFGYFVFDRTGSAWIGTFRDAQGRAVVTCKLAGRRLACGRWKAHSGG